jgi:hypothetical protein
VIEGWAVDYEFASIRLDTRASLRGLFVYRIGVWLGQFVLPE